MILDKDLFAYKINTVLKVIDGDTLDVVIDLGFNITAKKRIRLYGINTPECRTRNKAEKKRGLAAKARLKDLCEKPLILKSHGLGKYGRTIGELYTEGVSIGSILLAEGHAKEYYGGKR